MRKSPSFLDNDSMARLTNTVSESWNRSRYFSNSKIKIYYVYLLNYIKIMIINSNDPQKENLRKYLIEKVQI